MAQLSTNPGSPLSAYAAKEPAAPSGPKVHSAGDPWQNLMRPGVSRRMAAPRLAGEPAPGPGFPRRPTSLTDLVGGTLGKAGDMPQAPRAPSVLGRMAHTLPELPAMAAARAAWMRLMGAGR